VKGVSENLREAGSGSVVNSSQVFVWWEGFIMDPKFTQNLIQSFELKIHEILIGLESTWGISVCDVGHDTSSAEIIPLR
jgi:hypothetical protein